MKKRILEFLYTYPRITSVGCHLCNKVNRNTIRIGKANHLKYSIAFFERTNIKIRGSGNTVLIDDFAALRNCHIYINGNNNTIHVGSKCYLNFAELWVEDSNNLIDIGSKTSIHGKTHLAAIESTRIIIGDDCMLSSDIHIRTGDSHSVIDMDGKRTNYSQDVIIGTHCWIGTKVICLKGTQIDDNCIIGAGSLLSGKYDLPNCIIGGSPAHILRENVNWKRERIG